MASVSREMLVGLPGIRGASVRGAFLPSEDLIIGIDLSWDLGFSERGIFV